MPPGTQHLPLVLCLTLVLWLPTPALAQSSVPPDYLLKVVSAKYLPDKDEIQYKLFNSGNNPVTAFSTTISAEVDGKDAFRRGGPINPNQDLLVAELILQCKDSPENAAREGASPFHGSLPAIKGTIKPGATFVGTMLGDLLDKSMLRRGPLTVRFELTGIMWSDGTMEGTTGMGDMKRFRDWRKKADSEERDVLAVLNTHAEDGDLQHRINEATGELRSLLEGYPRELELPEDEPYARLYVSVQGVADKMIQDLDEAAYLPDPGERYTFHREYLSCVHDRRYQLQQVKPAVPAKSPRKSRSRPCAKNS